MPVTSTRAAHRTTGLIGEINAEWATLRATTVPAMWPTPLDHYPTIGHLVDAIADITTPQDLDATLHALVCAHRDGSTLAGRVLIQTMLGKVARLSRTAAARGLDDATGEATTAMWSAIANYPLHRRVSVAGNLAMEALAALPGDESQTRDYPAGALIEDGGVRRDEVFTQAYVPDSRTGRDDVVQVLSWACDHQVLSPADLQLLALVHLDGGMSLKDAGAALGRSYAATRQAHVRATRTLARAVATRMAPPTRA